MTWKTVANSHFGSSHKFGGNDIDKISNYFSAIEDVDTVDINTNWPIRDDKFKLRNPGNSASYIYSTSAIPADRTITEPIMSFTSDKPVYENATQILANKNLAASSPIPNDVTITGLSSNVGDPTIKRWGTYYPAPTGTTAATVGKQEGILSGHTPTATSATVEHFNGLLLTLKRALSDGGIVSFESPSTIGQFRLSKAGMFKVVCDHATTTGGMFAVGLLSYAAFAHGSLNTPDACAFFFADDDEDNTFRHKAGGSALGPRDNFSIPYDSNFHTYEMSWGPGTVSASMDGDTKTFTTNLPNPNTNLFFQLGQGGSHPEAFSSIGIRSVYIESE